MIDHLRHMAIFARVVDEGSFRGAAQSLGLAPSRISATVSDLEAYLGVTLLYRTTRSLSLTQEGRQFHAQVKEMLRAVETGLDGLNRQAEAPVGALRVAAPAFAASSGVSIAIASFLRAYPQVALTVSYSDRQVALIEEGFDVAIRIGWLADSAMMSRKLGEGDRVLVAGAEYVRSRPGATHPNDLESWDWLRLTQLPDHTELTAKDGQVVRVTGKAQVQVDSADALHHLAGQNLGVAVLPHHMVRDELASGRLQRLLPDWKLKSLGYYAVWPDSSRRKSLTKLFVQHLAENAATLK